MTGDNQANYAKIGFFIVAGVALVAATLVRLGGMGADRNVFLGETYFNESVSGLDVGSAVNFRGVRVGAVRRISFVRAEYADASDEDGRKIYVEMAFDARQFRFGPEGDRPERVLARMAEKGLRATIAASGVTGLSRIELDFPKAPAAAGRPTWRPAHVLVPPVPSMLQNAADSAQQILDQLNKMDFVAAYSNLLGVAKGAGQALESVNAALDGGQGGVAEIVENVRAASASLRDFADRIRDNPASLLRDRRPEPLEETR